jgi:hypothetical protein
MLTDSKLREINERRRQAQKSPLSRYDAEQAVRRHGSTSDDATDFLLGYATGVPWNGSAGGIMGAMAWPAYESSHSGSSDSSYSSDTGSSSSDSGSSSSSD